MKFLSTIIVIFIMFASAGSVTAQKGKKKKTDAVPATPSQPLLITAIGCIDCIDDIYNLDLKEYNLSAYWSDSAGSDIYMKLNDTAAVHARVVPGIIPPAFEKSVFRIYPKKSLLHLPYVNSSSEMSTVLNLNYYHDGKAADNQTQKISYDTVALYDFDDNKSLGRIVFPKSATSEKLLNSRYTSNFAGTKWIKTGAKKSLMVVMSFEDLTARRQYIRGYLFDSLKMKFEFSDMIKKQLNVKDLQLDKNTLITFDETEPWFEVNLDSKDEYSGGRSVYGLRASPDGSKVAVLFYGRSGSSVLFVNTVKKTFKLINDGYSFAFTDVNHLVYLKQEGNEYRIEELSEPNDTAVSREKLSNFSLVRQHFCFSPDGRFYSNGKGDIIEISTGNEYYIRGFSEKSVGETEPLRTKGLMLPPYYNSFVENSGEHFYCHHINFTPDGRSALAFYSLRKVDFANPSNPVPNDKGQYEVIEKKRWYIVKLALP